MTIAAFNVRAQKVVRSLGFQAVSRFAATTDGREYVIYTRAAAVPKHDRRPENRDQTL